MTALDYIVLLGTIIGIAAYGMWRTRRSDNLSTYLKGDESVGWGTVGLSVMATQASAITFLSTPGQGYESGLGFVQNYFGMPLALIIVVAVFLPIYRRLNVYTAYEFLGSRFDGKTRLLGAGLFLLQRGLAAGITIYAPAIIVSTVLGWRLDLTILVTGLLVIVYTVSGGSRAVSLTPRYQMMIILAGMATAFTILIIKMPAGWGFNDLLHLAGSMDKTEAVSFSFNVEKRYTIWSGIFGGLFLSLSYFGTDQSQVQRYLTARSLRASRLGLMFNAVMKIPMQFSILLMGVLLFVFYQFEKPPVFFNQAAWTEYTSGENGKSLKALEDRFAEVHQSKATDITAWKAARESGNPAVTETARTRMLESHARSEELRTQVKDALTAINPAARTKDSDYVFITFVLNYLPHGVIGLLIAVIFAAALSSTSSELNALGSTTTVDIYKHLFSQEGTEAHYVAASKWLTAVWGGVAVVFALSARFAENLIELVNIVGSLFYGVVLGIFLVAFFLKRVGGTAVFWGAVAGQALVIAVFIIYHAEIGYLWFNVIGCGSCLVFSLLLHAVLGPRDPVHELPSE